MLYFLWPEFSTTALWCLGMEKYSKLQVRYKKERETGSSFALAAYSLSRSCESDVLLSRWLPESWLWGDPTGPLSPGVWLEILALLGVSPLSRSVSLEKVLSPVWRVIAWLPLSGKLSSQFLFRKVGSHHCPGVISLSPGVPCYPLQNVHLSACPESLRAGTMLCLVGKNIQLLAVPPLILSFTLLWEVGQPPLPKSTGDFAS